MALKATIYKAELQIANIDRDLYVDRTLTIARHPSETDERMMVRVLAYALNVPPNDDTGALVLAKGLSDTDEPDLWRKDLTGTIEHWIELGQPDDKRLLKAAPRSRQVSVYSYAHSTPVWWRTIEAKIARADNIEVWQIASEQSRSLASLAQRSMRLQITVQDATAWIHGGDATVAIELQRLRKSN
jgi:uncharacterized protein YaeQ